MIGKTFGSLTVVKSVCRVTDTRNRYGYLCECSCGNSLQFVQKSDLLLGKTSSCGCRTKKLISDKLVKSIIGNHYGALTVVARLGSKTTDGYDHQCQCACGKSIVVKYNNLVRGATKSCGCLSDYYNSINNGGTGIPRERIALQKAIRLCKRYKTFVAACLSRANGSSELSGQQGKLVVHHKDSVSSLIKQYALTLDTYRECQPLFDPENGIVLLESEHRKFHSLFGLETTSNDWQLFAIKFNHT